MANHVSLFARGVAAALRGLLRAGTDASVRRTYRRLVALLFVLAVAIDVAGIWGILTLTDADATRAWYAAAAVHLLQIAGIVIVLLAAPVLSLFCVNVLLPMVSEGVFLAALEAVSPERARRLRAAEGLSLAAAANTSLRRLVGYLSQTLLAVALSFVPGIGPIIGPALQGWFTAKALGWELLDPFLDRSGMRYADQRVYIDRYKGAVVGFALPNALVIGIPLIGPLFFGLAQAAAASLVYDVLEREDRRKSALATSEDAAPGGETGTTDAASEGGDAASGEDPQASEPPIAPAQG